ncbi:STN domain-containing protein [Klebsiella indica]|nr:MULTISPECIES: STN domain-containing protein [Klebsiella]
MADYDIHFYRFDETAQALAHGTGCFIRTDLSRTASVRVNPVKGRMTIREALHEAIAGTALKVTEQQADSMTVR